MKELSLFTGMGGGIYGSMILGWETVAYVEQDEYCQKVIAQRIQDGWFDNGEIYGDIAEFNRTDAAKYAGQIDILTGGFPCQPFSVAGKREGTSDDRYLWDEIKKTIEIVRPGRLFFENVQGLLSDAAIIDVCTIIEGLGYQLSAPLLLGSDDCGNVHRRKRVWICATDTKKQSSDARRLKRAKCSQQQESQPRDSVEQLDTTDARGERIQRRESEKVQGQRSIQGRKNIGSVEDLLSRPSIPSPLFCGMDDELPNWRKQLKAIGNGQDPIVMATAYKILNGEIA